MIWQREHKTVPLLDPAEELAEAILREDGGKSGVTVYVLSGGMPQVVNIDSFPALVEFLDETAADEGASHRFLTSQARTVFVDPGVVKTWVEDAFGDVELGSAIGNLVARTPGDVGYPSVMVPLRNLLGARLDQCRAVLGLLDELDEGEPGDEVAH